MQFVFTNLNYYVNIIYFTFVQVLKEITNIHNHCIKHKPNAMEVAVRLSAEMEAFRQQSVNNVRQWLVVYMAICLKVKSLLQEFRKKIVDDFEKLK